LATVILDSGCFLPRSEDDKNSCTEIGYFGSSKAAADIRVLADGRDVQVAPPLKLGKKCLLEVRHVKADGTVRKDGVVSSETFHDELLHLKELYGADVPVNRKKFDCVIRFDSGFFRGALLKPRAFRLHVPATGGKFQYAVGVAPKMIRRCIAHN